MFRKKDEDTQEEFDDMNTKNSNDANTRSRAGSYQPVQSNNNDAQTRPVTGRAPAPATSAPAYRPQQGGSSMQPQRPVPQSASQTPSGSPQQSSGEAPRQAVASKSNKRVLTVGNDILLKGEIATCDRLVIEGMVDATLKDVHTVEISETGSFKGTAQIEDAEISGLFEGDLIVKNRLTIYSTGKVRGRIAYGEIEIERGGQMTGEIKLGTDAFESKKEKSDSGKQEAA